MADPSGFLRVQRHLGPMRPVAERLHDYGDTHLPHAEADVRAQASRCMDCGVPFCHTGCPLGNLVPDWNDLVWRGDWRSALDRLHSTNNFPEFTGRLCPAPCEEACVLAINDSAVAIKEVEWAIVERGWREGWIAPQPAVAATGRSVGIVGSGPAGLAAAQQLVRAGHAVTLYERDDRPGGLLRYGIPDFKLEKVVVDRRVAQLEAEGVVFECGVRVGRELDPAELRARHDAVLLATGAQRHRELEVPGRGLSGVHPAMDYLVQQNRRVSGEPSNAAPITAAGKRVVVLGGGDTSADCLGNALREGATSVVELAHGPLPPRVRDPQRTWPDWPFLLRVYPAHEEGGAREFQVVTTAFAGDGRVERLLAERVEFPEFAATGSRRATRVPGREVVVEADLVLLAIGFDGVDADSPHEALGLELSPRRTIVVDGGYAAAADGVWAAGDCVRGADLIVTAIADGREAARAVDRALCGRTTLPARAASERSHPRDTV